MLWGQIYDDVTTVRIVYVPKQIAPSNFGKDCRLFCTYLVTMHWNSPTFFSTKNYCEKDGVFPVKTWQTKFLFNCKQILKELSRVATKQQITLYRWHLSLIL